MTIKSIRQENLVFESSCRYIGKPCFKQHQKKIIDGHSFAYEKVPLFSKELQTLRARETHGIIFSICSWSYIEVEKGVSFP